MADVEQTGRLGGFTTVDMDEDASAIKPESSDYWRHRAEEARTRAEHMIDDHTKALMLGIADTYERIAKAYEEGPVRLEQPPGTKGG